MLHRHVQLTFEIEPGELGMLQRVFDQILNRRAIVPESEAAGRIAADLIMLFQHGIRDERQLLAMLSGTKNFP
jgi:hypothetical protein